MSERIYPAQPQIVFYQIGDHFLLNTHANTLTRDGQVVELEHRLVLLLVYFIEHAGEVLQKDVLLKTIWQGKVVNDDSLAVAVSYLRKALGDNSRSPRFIKTIQGQGYQFIGTTKPLAEPLIDTSQATPASDSQPVKKYPRTAMLIFAFLMLIVVLAAIAAGIKKFAFLPSSPVPAGDNPIKWQQDYQSVQGLLQQPDPESLRLAIKQFRDLIRVQGESAQAYMGIADVKTRLLQEKVTLKENCAEIIDLAQKALSLKPDFAVAHQTLANMAFWCLRDHALAEQHYLEAMKYAPQDDGILLNYAQWLLVHKRFDESLKAVELSRKLKPVNYSIPNVVWIYQMQGRDDLALRELDRLLTTEPEDRHYHISAKRIYERMGDVDKTFEQWLWLMRNAGLTPDKLGEVQAAFTAGGMVEVNRWLLDHKVTVDIGDYSPPLAWARYAIIAREYGQALDYLEQAFQQRQPAILWMDVDPAYAPLRNQPRFQKILSQLAEKEQ